MCNGQKKVNSFTRYWDREGNWKYGIHREFWWCRITVNTSPPALLLVTRFSMWLAAEAGTCWMILILHHFPLAVAIHGNQLGRCCPRGALAGRVGVEHSSGLLQNKCVFHFTTKTQGSAYLLNFQRVKWISGWQVRETDGFPVRMEISCYSLSWE